jgi:DNA-binding MarR family transcriptional regulator
MVKNAEKVEIEPITDLICELTRNCSIKEDYFAQQFNLTPTELRFLKLFVFSSSYTSKDLSKLLNITPGRVTHIVTSLEQKKLLQRNNDTNDKRVINVSLQPRATSFIENLYYGYNEFQKKILQDVGDEQLKIIQNSLEILVDIFKKWVNEKNTL